MVEFSLNGHKLYRRSFGVSMRERVRQNWRAVFSFSFFTHANGRPSGPTLPLRTFRWPIHICSGRARPLGGPDLLLKKSRGIGEVQRSMVGVPHSGGLCAMPPVHQRSAAGIGGLDVSTSANSGVWVNAPKSSCPSCRARRSERPCPRSACHPCGPRCWRSIRRFRRAACWCRRRASRPFRSRCPPG